MQLSHDDLSCGAAFLGNHSRRDTAPIVYNADGFVGMDRDGHLSAKPGQRLIDCIVDSLKNHVVQARTIVGIADIHTRTLSHRFKAFEHLDAAFIIDRGIRHKYSETGSIIIPSGPGQNPGKRLFLGVFIVPRGTSR